MGIGKLNKRVQIMSRFETSDGAGGFEDTLTEVKTVWASIENVSGRELWQAQQAQAELSHTITIRYTSITRENILQFGSRLFDIQYIINVNEESRFLEIKVQERQ